MTTEKSTTAFRGYYSQRSTHSLVKSDNQFCLEESIEERILSLGTITTLFLDSLSENFENFELVPFSYMKIQRT
jgi:hypothetical protein